MFVEDISAFFNQAEFAVQATFTPVGGAPVSASVLFNAETNAIFGEDVLSDEYTMTYPTGQLPGVRGGDYGTIDGVRYRVRDVRVKADGKVTVAKVAKAP